MTEPTIREWRLLINGPTSDDHGGLTYLYIRDDDGWFFKSFGEHEEVGDVRRFYGQHRQWPQGSPPEHPD